MRGMKTIPPPWEIWRQSFGIGALVLAAMAVSPPARAHTPGVVLSGPGTARIDGIISPGEWDGAGCVDFPVNTPEGGTTPGTVCAMNDGGNLYLAIRFARGVVDPGNSAAFEFENDHGGGPRGNGDDIILFNPSLAIGFRDEVRTNAPPCPGDSLCGFFDTDLGGTNDGAGAFHNDGAHTVYEFSHPLNTADNAHDFSLSPASVVGFTLSIRMIDAAGRLADTDFPTVCISCPNLFGDIVILTAPASLTAPVSPPPAPAIPPTAAVALNGPVFHMGQTVTYQAALTPASTPMRVDIYVGAVLPDGITFLSLVQGPSGVISIALGPSPIPFQANVLLTQSVVPFSYTFGGFEPAGTYVAYARLAIAGSNPLLPENQLALSMQSFQFSSDVCLSLSVSAGGSVTRSPAGTYCGPGGYAFAPGTRVTLTAESYFRFFVKDDFLGWGGDCAAVGRRDSRTHGTCTLVMTTNKSVSAIFDCPLCYSYF